MVMAGVDDGVALEISVRPESFVLGSSEISGASLLTKSSQLWLKRCSNSENERPGGAAVEVDAALRLNGFGKAFCEKTAVSSPTVRPCAAMACWYQPAYASGHQPME